MSDAVSRLLRITPRCEFVRCRRNGTIMLRVTHPKRPVQTAHLCPVHLPVMLQRVDAEGYTANVVGGDPEAESGQAKARYQS